MRNTRTVNRHVQRNGPLSRCARGTLLDPHPASTQQKWHPASPTPSLSLLTVSHPTAAAASPRHVHHGPQHPHHRCCCCCSARSFPPPRPALSRPPLRRRRRHLAPWTQSPRPRSAHSPSAPAPAKAKVCPRDELCRRPRLRGFPLREMPRKRP